MGFTRTGKMDNEMDNHYIAQAQAAYAAKDFQVALQLFSQCLQDPSVEKGPGDLGYLYHQIGNCFVQMRDFNGAIQAYTQATADSAYDACGAVNCNLAKAFAALHDYEQAVNHFEIAVSDAKYDSAYKAYLGMGNALLKLGKNAEAGVAFRAAALDQANPDPTKALINLGVCFMALNRPADAVQSYESALQFSMDPDSTNRLYANLGQAYVACGQMQKAMAAFETALADKTYFLSDSASVDYSRAATAVATGAAATAASQPYGGMDMSGLDVSSDGAPLSADGPYEVDAYGYDPYAYGAAPDDPRYFPEQVYGYSVDDGYATGEDRFFGASDAEITQYGKNIAKQDRKRRNVGLKILVAIVALLVVAAAGLMFLYMQGFGYPSQETVVTELFASPDKAADYFAKDISADDVEADMATVVQDSSVTVDGVEKTVSNSTVYVTADTPEGGQVQYKVSMVRDLLTWKVSDIELYFASQQS